MSYKNSYFLTKLIASLHQSIFLLRYFPVYTQGSLVQLLLLLNKCKIILRKAMSANVDDVNTVIKAQTKLL